MNAIVTVVGNDRVGIIADICTKLAEKNINVLDISQTIMGGTFTMIMAVDVEKATVPFVQLQSDLKDFGTEKHLSIHIQREDIFNAMHTI